MSESPTPSLFGIPHRAVVGLLLVVFFLAGALSLRDDAATFDETPHLPAGYTYLDRWDFRLNPEHPPLVKLWAALPLWLDGGFVADYTRPAWTGESIYPGTTMTTGADEWVFGYEFLNGPLEDPRRRDPSRALIPARLAMLVWGVLLGLVVFAWARELWGSHGALLALFLYCLSPTLLAHSRLVTTDMPAALGFTLAFWTFWRFTRQPDWRRGTLACVAPALALLIKFSALLLGPLLLAQGALWIGLGGERRERAARTRLVVYFVIGATLVSYFGLWAGYGFRYAASPDPTYQLDWEVIDLPEDGLKWKAIGRALEHRVLPQAYLYGLAYVFGGAQRRLAYLNGEESWIGWWYYFPEAFLLKTPPALLALLALAVAGGLRRTRGRSFDGWYLALPVLLYFAVSMASHLNIGHRHLTAIYPLLFIAAGGAATVFERARTRAVVLAVLVGGYVLSFAAATPGYLSYFNFVAGGPRGGWRYLLDSNLDWGQDLGRLARVMERHGIPRVHLAYFGTGDPKAYGFEYRKTYLPMDFYPGEPISLPARGDHLAVSVNLREGLYYPRNETFASAVTRRGWVSKTRIDEWSRMADEMSRAGKRHVDLPDWLVARGVLTPQQRLEVEQALLPAFFARLRDTVEPVAVAGDSIYIYRVP